MIARSHNAQPVCRFREGVAWESPCAWSRIGQRRQVASTEALPRPTLEATAWGASRGSRSPVDNRVLLDLTHPAVPRLAYHFRAGGSRGSQMEWIIESYDRRTDRDGENRFNTELPLSGRLRTYSATSGEGLCPQPFPMAQSSEMNGRCGR
jgi:hypothetical protein